MHIVDLLRRRPSRTDRGVDLQMIRALLGTFIASAVLLIGEHRDSGKERPAAPVPVWTGSGETGPESKTHRMFISKDGRELFVLTTVDNGKKQVSVVRLWNDVGPAVAQDFHEINSGVWRYQYTVSNQQWATDPIGTWSIILPPQEDGEKSQSPIGWGGQRPYQSNRTSH